MNYILQALVLSICLLTVLTQQQYSTTTTTVITSNAINNTYPNGGLNTTFSVGPTNFISGIQQSFNILLVPGQTTTFYLTGGLLDVDYNIYPLVGFKKNYQLNGAPNWTHFDNVNNIFTASPPQNWQPPSSFNITYSDSRPNSNSVTIPFTFSQGNALAMNQVAYTSTDPFSTAPNTYTIVYPLFTTTNSNLNSIKTNNYGTLTNVGTRPWTSLQPIRRQTGQFPVNNQIFNPPVNTVVVTNTNTTNITGTPNPYFNQNLNQNSNQNINQNLNQNQNQNLNFNQNPNPNLNLNQGQIQTQTTTTTQSVNQNNNVFPTIPVQNTQTQVIPTTQTSNFGTNNQWNSQPFLFSTQNPNEAAIINRTQTTVTTTVNPSSQVNSLNTNNGTLVNTVSPIISNIPPGFINQTTTTTTITGSPAALNNIVTNIPTINNSNTAQFPVSNQFNNPGVVVPPVINQNSILAQGQATNGLIT